VIRSPVIESGAKGREEGNTMTREKKEKDDTEKKKASTKNSDRIESMDDLDVCQKAPEWAEHQRWEDDDQPCDDGRSGNSHDGPE
jgi:hypothetical protein